MYKDLPIYYVNEWDELYKIDEKDLNKIYEKVDFSKVKERLSLDNWYKQIEYKRNEK